MRPPLVAVAAWLSLSLAPCVLLGLGGCRPYIPKPQHPGDEVDAREGFEPVPLLAPILAGDLGRSWHLGRGKDTLEPVKIGPDEGAALWLESLAGVRVRIVSIDPDNVDAPASSPPKLRFARLLGATPEAPSARGVVEVSAQELDRGSWYMSQPAGGGSVWVISAEEACTIVVERSTSESGRLIWETVEERVVQWADAGGDAEPPKLVSVDGIATARAELLRQAALGRVLAKELGEDQAGLQALRRWRRAAAIELLDGLRPRVSPYFASRSLDRALGPEQRRLRLARADPSAAVPSDPPSEAEAWIDGTTTRPYRQLRRATLRASGPGWVELELRTLGASTSSSDDPITLIVRDGERILHEELLSNATARRTVDRSQALPRKADLVTEESVPVGQKRSVRVPIPAGARSLDVELRGGRALARATHMRRREWTGNVRPGYARVGTESRRGGASIDVALRDPDALLDALFARILTSSSQASTAPAHVLARLEIQGEDDDPSSRSRAVKDITALLNREEGGLDEDVQWSLLFAALDLLAAAPRNEPAEELLWALLRGVQPSPAYALLLAQRLPPLEPDTPEKSALFALVESARRSQPQDSALRRDARSIWSARTRWRTLTPTPAPKGTIVTPAERWIRTPTEATPLREEDAPWSRNDRFRLLAGESGDFVAPVPEDPRRAPLLLATITGSATARLTVDDQQWDLAPKDGPVTARIAVRPGPHRIAVEGAPSSVAFLSLAPHDLKDRPERIAHVHSFRPLRGDDTMPLRYSIPAPGRAGPVRVELRASIPAGDDRPGEPLSVIVHANGGLTRTIHVMVPEPDPALVSETHERSLSLPVYALLELPPSVDELWFEGRGEHADRLRIGVAVRGDSSPHKRGQQGAPTSPSMDPPSPRTPDAELHPLRRARHLLRERPAEHEGYSKLADELRRLGWDARAQELVRYADTRRPPEPQNTADTANSRASKPPRRANTIESFSALGELARPVLLSPTTSLHLPSGAADLASMRASIVDAKAPHPPLTTGLTLAHLYTHTGLWQFGVAAINELRDSLELCDARPCGGGGPILHGLAATLVADGVDPSQVRLGQRDAGLSSAWESVRGTDSNAGRVSFVLGRAPVEAGSLRSLDRALAGVTDDDPATRLLSVGRAASTALTIRKPTAVAVDLGCERTRWRDPDALLSCTHEVLVDGALLQTLEVPESSRANVQVGPLTPGKHDVLVRLVRSSGDVLGSVRLGTDRPLAGASFASPIGEETTPIAIERRATFFTATAREPVSLRVAGPTTLRVELRTTRDLAPTLAELNIAGPGDLRQTTLTTSAEPDLYARIDEHRGDVSRPATALIILPGPGPYTLDIRPRAGRVHARVLQRVELAQRIRPPAPLPAPREDPGPPARSADPSLPPMFSDLPSSYAVSSESRPSTPHLPRLGTLSASTFSGTDDIGERDDAPLVLRQDLAIDYRHGFGRRAWIRASSMIRGRVGSPLVFGGDVHTAVRLPWRLRIDLQGRARGQRFSETTGFRISGLLSLSRPTPLRHDAILLPSLSLYARYLNLEGRAGDLPAASIDPQVYNAYSADHPLALRPALALRLRPRLDQVFTFGVRGVLNPDLRTLDNLTSYVAWRSLLTTTRRGDVLPTLLYRGGWRFADADRSAGYWRHELQAELAWSTWLRRSWRVTAALFNRAVVSEAFPLRMIFGLQLRIDLHRGRKLRDMAPAEQEFDAITGRRWWDDAEAVTP